MIAKKKKILGITTIRSDYDLMSRLYALLHQDKDIEFKLIVAGAHMSELYGHTVDLIEQDGFDILLKIKSLSESNTKESRIRSAAKLLSESIDAVVKYRPDLIIYAGDREDVIMFALLGGYLEIPTVHFLGGDHVADGHIDNPVRHATSKLSTAHMVAIPEHKERLEHMGEAVERIFVVGSIGLDKIVEHKPLSVFQIKEQLKIKQGFDNFALVIFHPLAEERADAPAYLDNIMQALKNEKINAFVSYPNSDPGNMDIIKVIDKYRQDDNFVIYKNLPRELFLSVYKHCSFIIGNSSSGIIESASIPVPAINVGSRQVGRSVNDNVIFCGVSEESIAQAIRKARSPEFKKIVNECGNLYGDGQSAQRAYKLIKEHDFSGLLYKKEDILDLKENVHG